MQEDQIKIRTVAQLPAAQFAIPDDGKTAPLTLVKMSGLPVASDHLHPRLLDYRINNSFRQPG